jgi:hypothetical protein
MKATKFVSIIAILAFASAAQREEEALQPVKTDVLQRACEYLWLVITIYQYIDPMKFIHAPDNDYFTVVVHNEQTEYLVYGKQEEWEDFFKKDLDIDPMNFKIMLN